MKVIPAGWTKEWAGGGRQLWTLRREPETVFELSDGTAYLGHYCCSCCGRSYHPVQQQAFGGSLGLFGSALGGLG